MQTNYEDAPATKLLATHCACCARPLVDATSVECGVGPECRKRHGWNTPDHDVELAHAIAVAASLPADVAAEMLAGAESTRQLANRIVHRIAIEQDGTLVITMTNVLEKIGFVKLSTRVSKRIAKVEISVEGATVIVRAPYNESAVAIMRSVQGRRWDREAKVNTYPTSSRPALFDALKKSYPGAVARGPKGLFLL